MGERGTVIVTGGASGIGLAAASALGRRGWRVLVADLAPESLARARNELGGADRFRFEHLDVTDETAVARVVAGCDRTFGPVRGLVNSAGIGRDVGFFETTPALFRAILDVNLVATFVVSREAARCMRAHGGGAIVNIASVSGLRGNAGRAAYGASKAGVVSLTQVMAVELAAHGIRVNAVAPGPTETPLVAAMHTQAVRDAWLKTVPQRRYASPAEVAGTICHLLDEEGAGFVTGQTIAVDGGFTAGGLLATE